MWSATGFEADNNNLNPDNIYLFKVNNRNTTKRCEISLKLTIEILGFITQPYGNCILLREEIVPLKLFL